MTYQKDLLLLHAVVFMWGATGLVGDQISLSALTIGFYRMIIAIIPVLIYAKAIAKLNPLAPLLQNRSAALRMVFSGITIGIHWITFFHAIKLSSVSIGLIGLSSAPLLLSILEPIFLRRKIALSELIIGMFSIASLVLILNIEDGVFLGLIFGIISGLADAVFAITTAKLVKKNDASMVVLYQMVAGAIFLFFLGSIIEKDASWLQIGSFGNLMGLLFLGVLCSALAVGVYVSCLKRIPTFTAVLSLNLEPVYGIALALAVKGEAELMSAGFYVGALILFLCVILDIYLRNRPAQALQPAE